MHALQPDVLVEVECDLTVGARPQAMPMRLEVPLDRLEVVELAIDDDPRALVFAGDRLIAGRKVDDAQPRMTKSDSFICGQPLTVPVGPAMVKAPCGAFDRCRRNRVPSGEDRCDATHIWMSLPDIYMSNLAWLQQHS